MADIKTKFELASRPAKSAQTTLGGRSRKSVAPPESEETDTSLFARAARALRQLPGAAVVESGLQQVEQTVLRELKSRLDVASGVKVPATQDFAKSEPKISRTYVIPVPEPAPRALADLLARAENQTSEQAQTLLFSRLLAQLVPDEARLLSALADGKPQAAIHVVLAPLLGSASRVVVENLSALGTIARVAWPENTPWYLTHLLQLGVLESGPETRGMDNAYAALESGADARTRISQVPDAGRLSPRFTRRTLRLSPLGKALWDACKSDELMPTK